MYQRFKENYADYESTIKEVKKTYQISYRDFLFSMIESPVTCKTTDQ